MCDVCGGIGIVAGLGTYGHKVMATIGQKIAKLTFTRGFAAQIGTALTVLCATQVRNTKIVVILMPLRKVVYSSSHTYSLMHYTLTHPRASFFIMCTYPPSWV